MNLTKIHERTLAEGFTQSEISEMMGCFQKWNWRYNQLLVKPGLINYPLMVGGVFHESLREWYQTKGMRITVAPLQFHDYEIPSLADLDEQKYWNAVMPSMLDAYTIHYKNDFFNWEVDFVEKIVEVSFAGFRLRGMIDLKIKEISNGGYWIVD